MNESWALSTGKSDGGRVLKISCNLASTILKTFFNPPVFSGMFLIKRSDRGVMEVNTSDMLLSKSNIFSQNGEDGVISAIFEKIGATTRTCCEFGAWDGIHLSNCRHLINQGWTALMIECDEPRFKDLVVNYSSNPSVMCVNKMVDAASSSLGSIMKENGVNDLDFLSVDIDGLDYEIFETMDVHPRVICIEVNAGHHPESEVRIDREVAKNNVGQPLQVFVSIAREKGYELVCYTGNAFFITRELVERFSIPVLTSKRAYERFLETITVVDKDWLYMVNRGMVNPYHQFHNSYLKRDSLGINPARAVWLRANNAFNEAILSLRRVAKRIMRG